MAGHRLAVRRRLRREAAACPLGHGPARESIDPQAAGTGDTTAS